MTNKINKEILENVSGGTEKATGDYFFHKVLAGETLTGIANHYGVSKSTIISLNKIKDENLIYAGQSLKIPCKK